MNRHRKSAASFTLIEVLVSLVVLSLVVLVTAQLVDSTSALTIAGGKRADTDTQARALFDRMAIDFGKIVLRPDVDYFFTNTVGASDQMAFYSGAPGYYPTGVPNTTSQAGVSLVGYRMSTNSYQLERLGKALIYSNTANSMVFVPTSGTNLIYQWPGILTGNDADYQVIANLVYRMEFNFLLKSYVSGSTTNAAVLSVTPWDTRQTGHSVTNGLSDVSAIVVAVALLDSASRKAVQTSQYTNMVNALPDASGTNSILQTWSTNGYVTNSGIPQLSADNIRLYQRTFYLGTYH